MKKKLTKKQIQNQLWEAMDLVHEIIIQGSYRSGREFDYKTMDALMNAEAAIHLASVKF